MFSRHLLVLYLRSLKKNPEDFIHIATGKGTGTLCTNGTQRCLGSHVRHRPAGPAAARGAGPARSAGGSEGCQGVSTAQAVLPECDQRAGSKGIRLEAVVCVCVCVRVRVCARAHSCYLRPCGMLHIPGRWASCPVKTERERALAKATQCTRERAPGSGPSRPHPHSLGGTLPLHFKAFQMLPAAPAGSGTTF